MSAMTRSIAQTPPTTPPAIAPVFDDELEGADEAVHWKRC